jgi:hypothetical protein
MDTIFISCAIIGGTLLLCQILLTVVGLGSLIHGTRSE